MTAFEEIPDLRAISDSEAEALCTRLRARILEVVSRTGGHLASSLGTVEITVSIISRRENQHINVEKFVLQAA